MNFVQRWLKQALTSVYAGAGGYGMWGLVREPYAGAWQKNLVPESTTNILAFSAVYACVTLICNDISKLRIKLIEQIDSGTTWGEVTRNSPYLPVLSKPNEFQTRQQFLSNWLSMKLLYGNAYILKQKDNRGVVTKMYVLDSRYVVPLVADDGSVFYQLNKNTLAGVEEITTIPASDIIHDRMVTLWHPLVGVTPIYACGAAATQGIRIQANSAKFFENMSMPSGQLTGPGTIDDVTAERLKREFSERFSGNNLGKMFVAGDGLKYEALTIPAADAQLIEQLKWTVDDVARCFLVPDYKIITAASGRAPAANLSALNQDYFNQCLQVHIESIELLLNDGLGLKAGTETEMDLDGLLRMDPLSRAETYAKYVQAGIYAPNEARAKENLAKAKGGDSPYLQEQNFSLEALAKRDALADPFAANVTSDPTQLPAPLPGSEPTPALPAPNPAPPKEVAIRPHLLDNLTRQLDLEIA